MISKTPNTDLKKIAILISTLFIACEATLSQTDQAKQETDYAHGLLNQVIKADKFIHHLDSLYTLDLPVGLASKNDKNVEDYAIIISKVTVDKGQTYLDAYMAFTVPGTSKKIAFKGEMIPFSYSGGIFNEAVLELVSDVDFKLTDQIRLKLYGRGKTSVTWDCKGYLLSGKSLPILD